MEARQSEALRLQWSLPHVDSQQSRLNRNALAAAPFLIGMEKTNPGSPYWPQALRFVPPGPHRSRMRSPGWAPPICRPYGHLFLNMNPSNPGTQAGSQPGSWEASATRHPPRRGPWLQFPVREPVRGKARPQGISPGHHGGRFRAAVNASNSSPRFSR